MKLKTRAMAATAATLLGLGVMTPSVPASSHREAPITALDRAADITDWFAFINYNDPTKVTMILNVDPLLDPGNGPTFFPFDPDIVYQFNVDNDNDAEPDIMFQVRFTTTIRAPGVFVSYVGAGTGLSSPANSPAPDAPGTPIVPPAITSLTGAGAAGLNLEQTYTVTMLRRSKPGSSTFVTTDLSAGKTLIAVPTNVGPRTMPNYPALFQQGIYDLGGGVSVFAGTVEDPFYIDLGASFDSLNFRTGAFASGIPGVMTDAEDANDTVNKAADNVSGYNVNSIAIQVPVAMLARLGHAESSNSTAATIGTYGSTLRPRVTLRRTIVPADPTSLSPISVSNSPKNFRQVQRLANPLINELIIGSGSKDKFSVSDPKDDSQFSNFLLDPLLPRALNAIYGTTLPIPAAPRNDLLPLFTYAPPIAAAGTKTGPVADLLRLNLGVPPTPYGSQHRLGLLAHDASGNPTPDPAGFPNGRRPIDDVTDITLRAAVGVFSGDSRYTGFPNNRLGDNVNVDDVQPYPSTFPYLSPAFDGRNSRHIDPGEPGGGPTN